MTKHTEEFSHLTFSQREGLVPIPGPLELGSLPDDLRYELWKVFENAFANEVHAFILPIFSKEIKECIGKIFKVPKRELAQLNEKKLYIVVHNAFVDANYNQLLDFLELSLKINWDYARERKIPFLDIENPFSVGSHGSKIIKLFTKYQAAYTLVYFKNTDRFNFHPITSEANKQALTGDLKAVEEAGYSGATQHFIQASTAIKEQDFKRAIFEAHSASEAIARDMTGKSTLGRSFSKLKSNPDIDNTLIKGMDEITSFSHASRHGNEPQPDKIPIGQDEAILMFSVNAAIAGYLAAKARKQIEE